MSAAIRSRTPDRLCAEAVDLAHAAAEDIAGPGHIGAHLGVEADGDRVVTHLFACLEPAYHGWRWAVTVARAPRARVVTVDESVLVPGPDALLAPEWVPWSERLRPGDLGVGDLLPTEPDDDRLAPGWTGDDDPEPETARGFGVEAIAEERGLERPRVLSLIGREQAAERWDEGFGGRTPMAQAAPAQCTTCGFLLTIGGPLGQAFGVCANEYAPADGRMVSLAYGCGAHSEAAVMPGMPQASAPVLDEYQVEAVRVRAESGAEGESAGGSVGGSVEEGEPGEELGHG